MMLADQQSFVRFEAVSGGTALFRLHVAAEMSDKNYGCVSLLT